MLVPIIEEFRSSKSPWEVFQRLHSEFPVCFFLDSFTYRLPDQRYSYLGAAPFLELILKSGQIELRGERKGRFPAARFFPLLRELFSKYKSGAQPAAPFLTGGALGYWGYELAGLFDQIKFRKKPDPGFPQAYLGFFREIIVYDHELEKYYLVTNVSKNAVRKKAAQREISDRFHWLKKYFNDSNVGAPRRGRPGHKTPGGHIGPPLQFHVKKFRPEIPRPAFEAMVRRAKDYIAAGDIYQANLSQRFSFEFDGSPLSLYGALRKINPSPFASFFKIRDLEIISSSPERLVRKRGRLCETRPIAGTRPRGHVTQEAALTHELLENEKERAEHLMLVDLERNDLGRVSEYRSVNVEEMMSIEKYSHVIHMVSKITGRLARRKDALDLIRAMFPGGTVTGCPKIRCMQIIDELEPVRRGIYTGSIGYIDFKGDLDLNIVIRTLILQRGKGHLQVGAGIVHDSDPAREFEETLAKGEALAEALISASSQ